jgi:hypothetical protein
MSITPIKFRRILADRFGGVVFDCTPKLQRALDGPANPPNSGFGRLSMPINEKVLSKPEALRVLKRMGGKSVTTLTKRELSLALKATAALLKLDGTVFNRIDTHKG